MTDTAESVISVDIEAEPKDVWDALITDEGLAKWMGQGASVGDAQGEDIFVPDIVTGEPKRGVLDEVTHERRLGYTWWPETAPEQATRVDITLTPCEVGTRVTVIESLPAGSPVLSASCSTSAAWHWRAALISTTLRSFCHA